MNEIGLLTVKQFIEKRNGSWPSEPALRAIILDASWGKNNFGTAFKRIGRRVLIDPVEFWRIITESEKKIMEKI